MKNYINKLFILLTLLFVGVSCENEAILTTLKEVNFSGNIEASSSTIVLSTTNANQSVLTLSWAPVSFPIKAPVKYALLFDTPSSIIGATAWKNAVRVEVGEDVLSKSFLGEDLNKMAIKLGLPLDVVGKIAVRVEAYLDRSIFSEPIILTVTPYTKPIASGSIFMPGSYQGWDVSTAAELESTDPGIFKGFVTFPATQGLGFKLTNTRSWSQFYGAAANGNIVDGSDTDFSVPTAGSYQITVNLNTSRFIATPYSWGIIGTATSGGWNTSTKMTYNHQLKQWEYNGPLVAGALKFRLNDAWTINYGPSNNTDGIMRLDNPGAYDVADSGNYIVVFKINEINFASNGYPATATYTVTKI